LTSHDFARQVFLQIVGDFTHRIGTFFMFPLSAILLIILLS
jgi:hypothetical protein